MSEIEIRDDRPARVEVSEARTAHIEIGFGGPRGIQGVPGSDTLTGPAGGVLSGDYPNPDFAEDMATQNELDTVQTDLEQAIADARSFAVAMGAAL